MIQSRTLSLVSVLARATASIAVLAGLASCGNGPALPSVPVAADLIGTYRACVLTPGGGYADTILTFTASDFTTSSTYYASSTCTGTSTGAETSHGTYVLESTTADGASGAINYSYSGGTQAFDIYKINGSLLQTGDRSGSNNGSTSVLRPTSLNTAVHYQKTS